MFVAGMCLWHVCVRVPAQVLSWVVLIRTAVYFAQFFVSVSVEQGRDEETMWNWPKKNGRHAGRASIYLFESQSSPCLLVAIDRGI